MTTEIKENALYYCKKKSFLSAHGIVYTIKNEKGKMIAIDTYWDSKFDKGLNSDSGTKYFVSDIIDDLEYIMMLDDVLEISKDEFCLYNPKDLLHIPTGGWHERYLVNKNAKKNVGVVLEYIAYKIEENLREIKFIAQENEKLNQWLYFVKKNPDIAQLYRNEKHEFNVETAMEIEQRIRAKSS